MKNMIVMSYRQPDFLGELLHIIAAGTTPHAGRPQSAIQRLATSRGSSLSRP